MTLLAARLTRMSVECVMERLESSFNGRRTGARVFGEGVEVRRQLGQILSEIARESTSWRPQRPHTATTIFSPFSRGATIRRRGGCRGRTVELQASSRPCPVAGVTH